MSLFEKRSRDIVPLAEQLTQRPRSHAASFVGAPPPELRPIFARVERAMPAPLNDNQAPPDPVALDDKRLAEAQKAGAAEARAAMKAELDQLRMHYSNGARTLAAAARTMAPRPEEVVDLALMVAESLVGRALAADREILMSTVSEALAAVEDRPATLHLSPADADHVGTHEGVTIVADPSLGRGELVIESRAQRRDTTVAARLAALREGLVAIVAEGGDK